MRTFAVGIDDRPSSQSRADTLLSPPARRERRGFTLVELLVVLAIAALAMSAVPPLFSAAMPGVEMKAAARRTVSSLRLARELAIRQGAEIDCFGVGERLITAKSDPVFGAVYKLCAVEKDIFHIR